MSENSKKFNTKMIISVEPVRSNELRSRERWNLKQISEFNVFHMQQSNEKKTVEHGLISKLVHQVKNHPSKDALIADLQNSLTKIPSVKRQRR